MSAREPLVLVLGTADWNAPIATNQHRVAAAFAERWPVVFAEGTGTRQLRWSDARRLLRRLSPSPATTGRDVPAGLQVLSPRLVPHHAASTRPLNTTLLHRQVRRWLDHDGPRLLWTCTPFTYGLQTRADRTVYHLVDLLHENPGVHRGRLLAAERELARGTQLSIGTSPLIAGHLRAQGFAVARCLPNVADVGVFAAARLRAAPREPVAVFAGTITRHKVDLDLLADLADVVPLRLVGPVGDVAGPAWDRIRARADVLGTLAPTALAAELARARVGLVPYRLSPLTAGISPLKTYEYLAAGLPVVSTALPAVDAVPGAVWVEDREAFVARVRAVLAAPADPARTAAHAEGHDWAARGRELRGLVDELLTT